MTEKEKNAITHLERRARTFTVAGILLVIIGLGLLGLSAAKFAEQRGVIVGAISAPGTVVGFKAHEAGRTGTKYVTRSSYTPIVRYTDRDGKTYEITNAFGFNPSPYEIGQEVEIIYDPKKPRRAKINDITSLWAGCIILALAGSIFATVGGGLVVSGRKIKGKVS